MAATSSLSVSAGSTAPFKAVDDVSLAVREGFVHLAAWPSGAGKSTILRMIGGFELPDDGTVRIAGHDVTMLAPIGAT